MSFVKGVVPDPILLGPMEVFQLTCFDMNWTVENSLDLKHNQHFLNWLVKNITHTHRAKKIALGTKEKKKTEKVFIVKFKLATCYVH